MPAMETGLAAGGVAVAVVGVLLTIYYAKKADELNKKRKRLEWPDLQAAANDLGQRIKRDFQPSMIVTPGLTGATFANLLVAEIGGQPPVLVGTRTWKADAHPPVPSDNSFLLETKKWIVTIPRASATYEEGYILIVDDFVMSGDFLDSLKTELANAGVGPDRVRSASIVVTKVAIKNHKAPDYYWWIADDDDFFFPWGKAK